MKRRIAAALAAAVGLGMGLTATPVAATPAPVTSTPSTRAFPADWMSRAEYRRIKARRDDGMKVAQVRRIVGSRGQVTMRGSFVTDGKRERHLCLAWRVSADRRSAGEVCFVNGRATMKRIYRYRARSSVVDS